MRKNLCHNGVTCILLYSGGLDSIIACKVLEGQGIDVKAIRFISPFFGYELKGCEERAREEAFGKYGMDLAVIDITDSYIGMLRAPKFGYGKHFNPCIDCRIFMLKEALKRLDEFGAAFVATGEVVGQRPFSQRRDALRVIDKEACAGGRVLRPLCAINLPQTPMEESGMVDRSRLLGISGRSRKAQIALAAEFGVKDYPTPSGGCLLADPVVSESVRGFIGANSAVEQDDIFLAVLGRRFRLSDGSWLVIGRDHEENMRILSLLKPGDIYLKPADGPGPVGLWRKLDLPSRMAVGGRSWHEAYAIEAENIFLKYVKRWQRVLQIEVQ